MWSGCARCGEAARGVLRTQATLACSSSTTTLATLSCALKIPLHDIEVAKAVAHHFFPFLLLHHNQCATTPPTHESTGKCCAGIRSSDGATHFLHVWSGKRRRRAGEKIYGRTNRAFVPLPKRFLTEGDANTLSTATRMPTARGQRSRIDPLTKLFAIRPRCRPVLLQRDEKEPNQSPRANVSAHLLEYFSPFSSACENRGHNDYAAHDISRYFTATTSPTKPVAAKLNQQAATLSENGKLPTQKKTEAREVLLPFPGTAWLVGSQGYVPHRLIGPSSPKARTSRLPS